ncbi:hypothetical protein CYR32_15990 [Chimaeribacter coloradensis]|uniref:Addiction module toxin RelE n=1 Tax=Chimaeribacter coloradensis TaxID=2060068 RepID=A0A2N5DXD0_9GAMM|nr:type II toxin-antitoxin system RelE/ParE family toxin [Chimaeribacter coloradensis]PLR32027.1 hypothetical protein CYR32_15990 [Chimaeribacter coloradensis]
MDAGDIKIIPKDIVWCGTSLQDLRAFPESPRATAGKELRKVQFGQDPADFKAVPRWGAGVIEILIGDEDGIYRVVYVAKFEEALYVLHGFKKTTQKTRQADIDLIKTRYRKVVNDRSRPL